MGETETGNSSLGSDTSRYLGHVLVASTLDLKASSYRFGHRVTGYGFGLRTCRVVTLISHSAAHMARLRAPQLDESTNITFTIHFLYMKPLAFQASQTSLLPLNP